MPRKTQPRVRVRIRKRGTSFFLPVCADQTAMAMVKLLIMSTMVFTVPRVMSSVLLRTQ